MEWMSLEALTASIVRGCRLVVPMDENKRRLGNRSPSKRKKAKGT
jgi:hypothetical protein